MPAAPDTPDTTSPSAAPAPRPSGGPARCWGRLLLASLFAGATAFAFTGCASVVRLVGPMVAPSALFRAECEAPLVALTIDDGPVPGSTERLLEVLRDTRAHATFFLVGERARDNPALLDAIRAGGHELGNHTFRETPTHRLPADEARESILRTHDILSAYGELRWLRPGSARYDDAILETAGELGYRIALADTFPYDTFLTWTAFHAWYIRHGVRPGSVIILHNAHGRGQRAARTLAEVIPRLHEDGYEVLSLTELVTHPACTARAQNAPPANASATKEPR